MTQRITYADIGRALGGISRQAVHKLVKRGMPATSIESAQAWHLANVDPFRQAVDAPAVPAGGSAAATSPEPPADAAPEDTGLRQARTRQANAAAELSELELQERRGDLVSLKAVALPVVEDFVLRICAALDNLPARAAPEVAATSDVWQCEQLLKDRVTEIREAVRQERLQAVRALQGISDAEDDDDGGD